ncbi:Tkl protein kinase, partial [Globisporangium splendens]
MGEHVLSQFLVPKVGYTLPNVLKILDRDCSSMLESEVMSRRVYSRLRSISQQLHDVDVVGNTIALNQYSDVVARFHQFVARHARHDFATRMMLCLQVAKSIEQLHEDIDRVESALRLEQSTPSVDRITRDHEIQLQLFGAICHDNSAIAAHFRSDQSRLDALTLVRNVIRLRRRSRDKNVILYWETVAALEQKLAKFCIDLSDVIVAEWFVPPYLVDCNEEPFSRGSFGAVYYAKMNGADVVVKQILAEDDGARAQFLKEVKVWSRLRHPHVLPFLGACHIGRLFFVCENAKNGMLPQFLRLNDTNRQSTWKKLYEVALGLQYLHDQDIIHGDLKGNNLLVGADGNAKLADFGLSIIVASSSTLKPVEVGAPRWRSPEVLRGESISMASDIYSFGMCIVEAVTGEYPWGNSLPDAAVSRNVKLAVPLLRPRGFSDPQWELVTRMIVAEPSRRVKIAGVVQALEDFRSEETMLPFSFARNFIGWVSSSLSSRAAPS